MQKSYHNKCCWLLHEFCIKLSSVGYFSFFKNHLDKNSDNGDDLPQLSAHTLTALQEFYSEKERQEKEATEGNTDIDENWV